MICLCELRTRGARPAAQHGPPGQLRRGPRAGGASRGRSGAGEAKAEAGAASGRPRSYQRQNLQATGTGQERGSLLRLDCGTGACRARRSRAEPILPLLPVTFRGAERSSRQRQAAGESPRASAGTAAAATGCPSRRRGRAQAGPARGGGQAAGCGPSCGPHACPRRPPSARRPHHGSGTAPAGSAQASAVEPAGRVGRRGARAEREAARPLPPLMPSRQQRAR